MFSVTNIVKYSDNKKWIYSGYAIVRDAVGSWSFGITMQRILAGKVSITRVTEGILGSLCPPNSLDLHHTQNEKMKSWTNPPSSRLFPGTAQVFSDSTPIT